ncbi:MAG: ketoacyl-ACP synthase III [Verrucomicrobiota bacterium]
MIPSIRIKQIAAHVPDLRESTLVRGSGFGYDSTFLKEKLGTLELAVKEPGRQTSDLCVAAARNLEARGVSLDDIGALIVCTQTPDGHGIPHTSAVVHGKLGLPDSCACFDLSLGCSGYVYGLSVVMAFMQAHGIRRGLFFTCDPYSEIVDADDQATSLLFGDAATVTLLEANGPGWAMTDILFGTQGKGGEAIHNRSGKLHMNGREVFNFALTQVPRQIRALLDNRQLTLDEVDLVALHQGSRYIVEKIRERLNLCASKAPVHLKGIGNTVSSAIPLLLEQHLGRRPARILLSGFGVGLSYASALLEWQDQTHP